MVHGPPAMSVVMRSSSVPVVSQGTWMTGPAVEFLVWLVVASSSRRRSRRPGPRHWRGRARAEAVAAKERHGPLLVGAWLLSLHPICEPTGPSGAATARARGESDASLLRQRCELR